jgi:hypothetical protein
MIKTIGITLTATFLASLVGLVACGGAQTHRSVELTAYAADDAVCDVEATDKDSGTQCLDKYKRLYSTFFDAGTTVCDVTTDGGSK